MVSQLCALYDRNWIRPITKIVSFRVERIQVIFTALCYRRFSVDSKRMSAWDMADVLIERGLTVIDELTALYSHGDILTCGKTHLIIKGSFHDSQEMIPSLCFA